MLEQDLCLDVSYSLKKDEKITVLVATSGDTGGAVANGFMDIEVLDYILYPKNKVSDLQERQFQLLVKILKQFQLMEHLMTAKDL